MKRLSFLATMLVTVCIGCQGPERNPLKPAPGATPARLWWQTPYYAGTPKSENPWLEYVKENKQPNDFDPWANDDLQRYSESPVVVPGAPPTERVDPPTKVEPEAPKSDQSEVF